MLVESSTTQTKMSKTQFKSSKTLAKSIKTQTKRTKTLAKSNKYCNNAEADLKTVFDGIKLI